MKFSLPLGPMLTKTKNIRKKIKKKCFFFSKIQKRPSIWLRGSNNKNLKEIRASGSEMIAIRTDGRRTDGRRTNFDFMSSADIVKQS